MLAVLFYSCKSIPNPNQEYMYVMIYDYYNNGVKNVSIYLDDKIIGRTDVYGRFSFPIKNDNSKHTLSLQKDNYEKITDTIFYTRNEVLYYKMGESFFYFEEAEKQFDSKNYDYGICTDTTDIDSLRDTGVTKATCIIVAISDIQDSIMTCANLIELGFSGNIIARAQNMVHKRILKTMGVQHITVPEIEVANRVALQAMYRFDESVHSLTEGFS